MTVARPTAAIPLTAQIRKCSQRLPIFRHSSQPWALGFTTLTPAKCEQISLIIDLPSFAVETASAVHSLRWCHMSDEPAFPAPSLDPTDPYAREAQIFPQLSQDMAARICAYGRVETLPKGTLAFQRGLRTVDFFLVLQGMIEVFDTAPDGVPKVLTVHRDGQFTGELDLFNDRMILLSARASVDTGLSACRGPSSAAWSPANPTSAKS